MTFVRVWEYDVAPDAADEFERVYGADGDWAQLFARAPGFLGTELFRSAGSPTRYVTVDRFADEESWRDVLAAHREEYDALDRRCEHLTVREERLV